MDPRGFLGVVKTLVVFAGPKSGVAKSLQDLVWTSKGTVPESKGTLEGSRRPASRGGPGSTEGLGLKEILG